MARQCLEGVKSVLEFKERTKKEEDAAYKFFVVHKDTFCSPENLGTASQIIRHQLELNRLKNERCADMLKAADERRKKEQLEYQQKLRNFEATRHSTERFPPLQTMRPVSPETRKTLYDGISSTGGGRAKYLSLRYQKYPEEKYNFKLPTSWDYGWYFNEMVKSDNSKTKFHHSNVIQNTLFGRNGIPMEDVNEIVQKKVFV